MVVTDKSYCRVSAFCGLLLERGIKVSMDGKGRYLDNIFVERLWRSVKYEEVYLKAYRNGVVKPGEELTLIWSCTTESDHTSLWAIGLLLRCSQRKGQSGVYQTRHQPYHLVR